jgi:hypothetical protein
MHDEQIDLAVGMGATSRFWKNQKWTWADIAEKLLTEHKTNETFKQFIGATKDEQLKIKDVGGYVGGYLSKGRRKPGNVLHRQLITLDIDEAPASFWDSYKMQFDNAAVLHGTHKHSKASPRYRLVMPMSREASPDEYVAASRFIAGMLGIDYFDNTTFQPERLMFWPSSSIDAEYFAKEQKGPWVDVDDLLAAYTDWTDSSSWPTAESAIKEVGDASKKQEDPETKRGVIGAFCRTFSITEAIDTFLSEDYTQAADGRYTYAKGSAAGGLVIYDDKYAFSHHGTDPSGGKLCNAFDLVRIHKYGHLDTSNHSGGAQSKSFKAMEAFIVADKNVKQTIAAEKIADSSYDFAEPLEEVEGLEEEEASLAWAEELEIDGKGKYLSTANNISLILSSDPRLKGVFQENSFDDKKYVVRSLPWRKVTKPEPIRNVDYSGIRNYIEAVYGIANVSKIEDSLNLEFLKYSFHPVQDYLNGLTWDGVKRIDNLLVDYFGADDNIYTREAIRKPLVGAVARIFRPGTKFDLVLTIVGSTQGTGKSTFIAKLGKEWYSDSFHTISGKEAFEQLQGAWVMEMAELSGLRKSEIEATKHFLTKQEDTYRPAYGKIVETYKRKCIFIATTNKKDFLQDPSGNRRFMPVDVNEALAKKSSLDEDQLVGEQINQLWAEAVALYRGGEKLYLSPEAERIARLEQINHSQEDDRKGIVELFLERPLPKNWEAMDLFDRREFLNDPLVPEGTEARRNVCLAEIWCECLGKERHDMTRYNTREINDILRSLEGWEQIKSPKNFSLYGKQKYYSIKLL